MSPRLSAVLQAAGVTLVWSSSVVLIKIGLEGIPPLMFAGLRYALAFACLLIFVLRSPATRGEITALSRPQWRSLVALGVVYYGLGMGAQFAALGYLPSVTLSLIMNFTPIAVAVFAFAALKERPTRRQMIGIGGFLLGVLIYFAGAGAPEVQAAGLLIGIACMLTNSVGSVMARGINRQMALSALTVTIVSMGIGAALLLTAGLLVEGLPPMTATHWAIVVWLAVVHTALAFVTWNRALRHLTAVEASLITSMMLVLVAVLAWVFLNEPISRDGAVGLAVASAGILLVQVRR